MTLGSLGPDCDGRPIFPGDRVEPAPGYEDVHDWVPSPPWTVAGPSILIGDVVMEERATDDGGKIAARTTKLRKLRRPRSGFEAASGSLEDVLRDCSGVII